MEEKELYVKADDIRNYVDRELYHRRNDRYQYMSFEEVAELIVDAIDSADMKWE